MTTQTAPPEVPVAETAPDLSKKVDPVTTRAAFGGALTAARAAVQFSQRRVATALDVTAASVCNWEKGVCLPSEGVARKLFRLMPHLKTAVASLAIPASYFEAPTRGRPKGKAKATKPKAIPSATKAQARGLAELASLTKTAKKLIATLSKKKGAK